MSTMNRIIIHLDIIIIKQKELQNQQAAPTNVGGGNVSPDLEARFQRIEQKVDKLIKHLGVK